jgi:AcrR family transcriptional regulator
MVAGTGSKAAQATPKRLNGGHSTGQTARKRGDQPSDGGKPASAPHERLLDVACEMFCRDGIHATGIDRILASAGVSKMTLYAHFGSKDGLLREVLLREGASWRAEFETRIDATGADAAARLAAIPDALRAWFEGGRFYGCAFMNAAAEHSKGEPWLRAMAADHHRQILDYLGRLTAAAGHAEPAMLARQILLVLDGAIAALMVSGDAGVLDIAARNLRAVLKASDAA